MPKKIARAPSRRAKPKTKRNTAKRPRASTRRPNSRAETKRQVKPFHTALVTELETKGASMPEPRDIARKAIDQALAGEKEARVFIADRLDGKVSTAAVRDGTEEQVTVVIRRFAKDRTPG